MKTISALALLLVVASVASAKGKTVKIEIRGDGLAVPIEIVDERTVSNFSVWNGPGVGTYTKGVMDPPAYLNPDKPQGRFVDWPRGIATRRPERLHRFEVTFYLGQGPNQRKYLITYEVDRANEQGFVFLPLSNTAVIAHGIEGNWFYASEKWDETIMPMVLASAAPNVE